MDSSNKGVFTGLREWFTGGEIVTRSAPVDVVSTAPMQGIMPPLRRSDARVLTEHTAMSIPGVSRATSLIAGSIGQLPLDAYKQGAQVYSGIIESPSETMSRPDFLSLTASNLAVYGNAYWLKTPYLTQPGTASMDVLNPELVRVELRNGRKVFHYDGKEYSAFQVEHLMVNPRHAPSSKLVLGVGPIQDNRAALQAMLDLAAYADKWFNDAGYVSHYLKTEQELDADTADAIADRWTAKLQRGGIPVVGRGVELKALLLNPAEAQFHEASRKAVTDVARMFGVPANLMLAETQGNSYTYSNVGDNDRQFVRHTLMSYVKPIETAFTRVSPNGQKARLNLDALVRPSTKERMDIYKIGAEVGAYTTNEIRELEDRPPLQEGDLPEAA